MNIGNLVKNRISESCFGNLKELYEAMKEIIGEKCCAYNTFTESLNKNKRLSDLELLTLAVLLDIDLNKLAMHYVNSKKNTDSPIRLSEHFNLLKQDILSILNYESKEYMERYIFEEEDICILNNNIYALATDFKCNSVLCFEVNIKRNKDDYIIKLNQIAHFDYLKSILLKNSMTLIDFKKLNLSDKISLIKEEGQMFYEIFPETKPESKEVSLSNFKISVLSECIKEYINHYKSDMNLDNNNYIYDCEGYKFTNDIILNTIKDELLDKKLNPNIVEELEEYSINLFNEICSKELKVYDYEY